MRPGGGVLPKSRLHLGAIATHLAPHDGDVHPVEVAIGRSALRAQFDKFILQLRRSQENRAPSVAPSRDPAQRIFVLAADDDRRATFARGLRIASYWRKFDVAPVERGLVPGPQLAHRGNVFARL